MQTKFLRVKFSIHPGSAGAKKKHMAKLLQQIAFFFWNEKK